MGRYDKVAQYFTSKGYVVCGIDIIGHGHSLQNGSRKALSEEIKAYPLR